MQISAEIQSQKQKKGHKHYRANSDNIYLREIKKKNQNFTILDGYGERKEDEIKVPRFSAHQYRNNLIEFKCFTAPMYDEMHFQSGNY